METMWNVIVDFGLGWGLGVCIFASTWIAVKAYERAKRSEHNIKRSMLGSKHIETKMYGER